MKLSPSGGALRYSSYLGGNFEELGFGIALRTVGTDHEVYLTGMTNSPDFRGNLPDDGNQFNGGVPDPFFVDAYAVKFVLDAGNNATPAWATFIGGQNDDGGNGIAVDADGHAIVVGGTRSLDFPVTDTAFDTSYNTNQDAFVAKLDVDGACCLYATFLGGAGNDEAFAVALDSTGHVYVTGRAGAGFPTSPGAFDTSHNGGEDVFVARIDTAAGGRRVARVRDLHRRRGGRARTRHRRRSHHGARRRGGVDHLGQLPGHRGRDPGRDRASTTTCSSSRCTRAGTACSTARISAR